MTFAGASGQRFETVVLHLARFILDRSGLEDRLARLAQCAFDQFRHGFLVGPGFPLPVSLIKSVFFVLGGSFRTLSPFAVGGLMMMMMQ